MATGTSWSVPEIQWLTTTGAPNASGSLYVYQTGTTTKVTIYSDYGLTTPISNPITLDSNGRGKFYVDGTVNLRLDSYTSGASLIESIDPVLVVGGANAAIPNNSVTNAMLAQMAAHTVKGNASGSLANAGDLTAAQLALGMSLIITIKRQIFLTTGTYTPNTNMIYCDIEVWGAGGGGGGVNATSAAVGGGGGGGGYSRKSFAAATIGASKAVTIGAGGIAGTNAGGTGGTGGTTSVGATLLQATGGAGGVGSTVALSSKLGGIGGVGSVGDDNRTGIRGGTSIGTNSAASASSGVGGDAPGLGGGSVAVTGSEAVGVTAAANTGGGGSGALSAGNAFAGGVGGSGYVVVTEYCSA